ncbi:MAG: DUF1846 domain-containing protein [Candidatus Marinimicrobia bacterium]|nr:DUF1846 domain-containing protein [Candidatus Neomarinimicrobiota bacterium]
MAGIPKGFDNEKYLAEQSRAILERVDGQFSKLYLEFGGKLIYDYHAARVLPGFDPNVKIRLLQQLQDKVDVILCIYAGDIERNKIRADFGISYDSATLKTIDDLKNHGISVSAVVITRYESQAAATSFKNRLERRGIRVFTHGFTRGYPTDVDLIVSEEGYGANPYIKTKRPIVVVSGPGPNSGKLATCLSQLYHEYQNGVNASYAKFETFPIWNLPLKHPVNVAYESATADLRDVNMVDHFHLEAYGKTAINYNRDIEAFPLLRLILERITGQPSIYQSPTDMGVNRAGFGIIDDEAVRQAANQEIIRRYFKYAVEYALGQTDRETVDRAELIMKALNLAPEDRRVVSAAREAARKAREQHINTDYIFCGAAIELPDGRIVTGKNSALMHSTASMTLNAIKHLANIPDTIHLLPPNIIKSLKFLKKDILKGRKLSLDLDEILIVLGLSAVSNPAAQTAMEMLRNLAGCEVHNSHIPSPGDAAGLRKLGIHYTSDPKYPSQELYLD